MAHLDDGVLRRMIDEPMSIRDTDRRHYGACGECQIRSTAIADDARWAHNMMLATATHVDAAAAFGRVGQRLEREGGRRKVAFLRWPRTARTRLRSSVALIAAVATVVGALAFTPAGSLAQNLITVFQPTQIVAVQIQFSDLQTLQELSQFGTISAPTSLKPQTATSAQDAANQSGLEVLTPTSLPSGIPQTAKYSVIPGMSGSFTFSSAKAAATAAASGQTLPPIPAGMDGSSLEVTTGFAVITTYRDARGGIPALIISEAKTPTLVAKGVTVKVLEKYLLGLPGVSPALAAQIRAIGDPTTALPIPVLVDKTYADPVTVQGVKGLAVGDSTGAGAGVVWQKNGMIYGVGGPMSKSEAVQIAESLVVVSR